MIKIVVNDKVYITEDSAYFYTDGKRIHWTDLYHDGLPGVISWEATDELITIVSVLAKLNEKGFFMKVEHVNGTWDIDILNATPQESHISPYKKFNGEADKLFNVMSKLP